jgi:hypothetical protein
VITRGTARAEGVITRGTARPEGVITRGTTNPNRLRRCDRWIVATQGRLLRASDRPLVVDLGFGAAPTTTVELYRFLRPLGAEVVGLEISPERVAAGRAFLDSAGGLEGLSFGLGGFELPVSRKPVLVRAFNVLRQYSEAEAWRAWSRMCGGLAAGGVLVEGTCDEIGRRAVWVTLGREGPSAVTFAARVQGLSSPSELAERLPKTLIHRNVPGERVHAFLADFDRAWATAAPHSVFGPRRRWIVAVELLARTWPVCVRPPLGGRGRWRLGEVTVPWSAVAPLDGVSLDGVS